MKQIPKIPYSPQDLVGFIFAPLGLFFLIAPIIMKVVILDTFTTGSGLENLILLIPFLLIGGVFTVIGGLLVWRRFKTIKEIKWLFQNGKTLQTKIISITQNPTVRVNGVFAWKVFTEYNDGIRQFKFQSADLTHYPNNLQEGDNIEVLVNPDNYNIYYLHI